MGAAAAGASLGLSGASSLLQYGQKRSAADIIKSDADVAASQIELGAIQREGDRKARLAQALSSQIATSGARGISAFEGSPLTIMQADVEAEERATERDKFQSELAAMTAKAKAQIQAKGMRSGAAFGLLADVGKLAALAPLASSGAAAGPVGGIQDPNRFGNIA